MTHQILAVFDASMLKIKNTSKRGVFVFLINNYLQNFLNEKLALRILNPHVYDLKWLTAHQSLSKAD